MTDYVTLDQELSNRIREDCKEISDRYHTDLEKVINQYHTIIQERKGYTYLQNIHKTRVYFRNEHKKWLSNAKDTST